MFHYINGQKPWLVGDGIRSVSKVTTVRFLHCLLLKKFDALAFLTSTKLITEDCDDCSIERFLKDREQLMSLSPAMVEEIPSFSHVEERDVEKWKEAIERSVEDIRTGLLDKVVLAREVSLHFEGKIPSGTILQNLTEQQP